MSSDPRSNSDHEVTPPPPPTPTGSQADDDEPLSPTSAADKKRKRRKYRNPEFRKELRKSYFNLENRTSERRKELMDPKRVDDLNSIIGEGNKLFEKIELAREGNIDSRWFKDATDISCKQIEAIHLGKEFNLDFWIDLLKIRYKTGEVDDEGDPVGLDWLKLGKDVAKFYLKPPPTTFMNGPLNIELKKRKHGKRMRRVAGRAEKPEVLKKDQRTETSTKYVRRMQRKLRKMQEKKPEKKIDLLNEMVDEDEEEGFTKTIENFFYFSFLVKDNKVKIEKDDDEFLFTRFVEGTSATRNQDDDEEDEDEEGEGRGGGGQPERSQHIMRLDLEKYKQLIKKRREEREGISSSSGSEEEDEDEDDDEDRGGRAYKRRKRKKKKKEKKKKKRKKSKKRKRGDGDDFDDDENDVDKRPRKRRKRK